ncbi:MAG: hypothetical protein Q7T21_03080 [Gallionella sp.]|nr:hypothetical protein [Gallionella sp.]
MSAAALIQRAEAAGVSLRLVNGKVKITGKKSAVAKLIEPLREHKADLIRWFTQSPANEPEPPNDPAAWRELAAEYHGHHFACKTCCAAGQGRGLRCGTGAALWISYQSTN